MIKPTVGRVLWFWRHGKTQVDAGEQPEAAIIAHVWSDTCVNLAVFDGNGVATNFTSVPLIQAGDAKPESFFCEWMPYQQGQAAKTEELQAKLAGE